MSITRNRLTNYSKKWNLIFFKLNTSLSGHDTDLTRITLEKISNDFDIDQIYFYTYDTLDDYQDMIDFYQIEVVILKEPHVNDKIKVINELINKKCNSIFLGTDYGYLDFSKRPLLNDKIYSKIVSSTISNNVYQNLAQKLKLKHIINTNILILPYNNENRLLIDRALSIAMKIKVNDPELATNIAISVINRGTINDIDHYTNNFVSLQDSNVMKTIEEQKIINSNSVTIKKSVNSYHFVSPQTDIQLQFNHSDYIFYPYLDLVDGSSRETLIDNPDAINTNGIQYNINMNNGDNLINRFDNSENGLFIRKKLGSPIVPTIIHHLWINEEPDRYYTDAWGKMLREPWQYHLWSMEKINSFMSNSSWKKLLDTIQNVSLRRIIIGLAILEKHGGIIIDSYVLPIKLFSNEIRMNHFFIGLFNERISATKLSYRVYGSVPGAALEKDQRKFDFDAARRPFEGKNNFFINAKIERQAKLTSKSVANDKSRNPDLFRNIYQVIKRNSDLDQYLLKNTMVYPSYYFNPLSNSYPSSLSSLSTTKTLWKEIPEKKIAKTELKRKYIVPVSGIMAKLNENPRDRIKNLIQ